MPNPKSIIYPKIKGDSALKKTLHACNKAFTVPKLSKSKSSAHKDPINGILIPKFNPNKDIYKNIEKLLSKKIRVKIAKNKGIKVNMITLLVLYLSIIGPPKIAPIIEKKPKKINPCDNICNVQPFWPIIKI